MIRAVLFDWGDTLMHWVWEDELAEAGQRAGLAALGRSDALPDPAELTGRYRERFEAEFADPTSVDEFEYPGLVRGILAEFGVEVSDEELDRFLEAEHDAWTPARQLGSTTHALLEALRARDLRVGLVSNAFDPPWLLHRDLERTGVAALLDVAVFSSEVGRRKPHPEIFERALQPLGVPADEVAFVGDRLREDIGGAAAIGMTTVQALWFRAEQDVDGIEPDYHAFTQMDVLNIVRRLNAEA